MNISHQQKIETILNQMSLEQKIGQCVVVGMSGTTITNDLREAVLRYHCGGIRLSPFFRIFRYFSDSKAKKQFVGDDFSPSKRKMAKQGLPPYKTVPQFVETLNELRQLAASRSPAIPLHMVIDQEGDTSKDYALEGVVQFPSNLGMAASHDPQLIFEIAFSIGKQMKAAGLDMIHSPVVDVNINPLNPEIGRRAFGDDPETVADYAVAMLRGFQKAGVIAAAKHFPGRGDSATDAHFSCPILNVDHERFHQVELFPYKKLIEAGIDSIMVAHCMYPHLDPDNISTVSRPIVTGLLRQELGFEGLITTDSMTMGALIDRYGVGESCARALAAGVDVILMKAENEWRGEMFYTIQKWVEDGRIDIKELDQKVRRVLEIKFKYGLFENMGIVEADKSTQVFSDPLILQTSQIAAQKSILILKDDLGALPVDKNKKVLLINQLNTIKTPNHAGDHPSLFSELLEQDWHSLDTLETDFGNNSEDEQVVLDVVEQGNYDLILCTNFYDRSCEPQAYPKKLIERGYPVVLITNTPYCIKEKGGLLTDAKTIILNMNLTPQGYQVTRDVLLGLTQPLGQWPLKNYNPLQIDERSLP